MPYLPEFDDLDDGEKHLLDVGNVRLLRFRNRASLSYVSNTVKIHGPEESEKNRTKSGCGGKDPHGCRSDA